MESATAVGSASTMKASATVESTATAAACCEPASSYEAGTASCESATTTKSTASDEAAPAKSRPTEPAASIKSTTAPIPASESVEPGARSDEDSAREPIRPVIAVWRASVGLVAVIPVLTNRSSIPAVHGTDSYSNSKSNLCLRRCGRWKNENC